MQFAVIGLGVFGRACAFELQQQGNEVLGIDLDEEEVNKVSDVLAHSVIADATDIDTLQELNLSQFDGVIVSIGDDLDGADNGTLDTSSLGTILDAVGVSDAVADDLTLYGSILGGTDILYNGQFEPLTAFRDGTTGDWYNTVTINFGEANEAIAVFDISGTQVAAGDFDIDPTTGATFGSANPSRTTASVNDFNKKLFSVYPNPTNTGSVSVVSSNRFNFGSTNIAIYDVLGKQVINKVMTSKKLDVSLLNTGVYIMKITQGKATTTKKLVIN